jgi:hypothetical protein
MEEKNLFKNQQWKVLSDFTILCEKPFYEITTDILNACDWEQVLNEKNWCKISLFKEALNFVNKNYKNG